MLALCEIRYDYYSRFANTCCTHSTRAFAYPDGAGPINDSQ